MIDEDAQLARDMVREEIIDIDFYSSNEENKRFLNLFDAAIHYLETGEERGFAPSGKFDPVYYLRVNPDLVEAGSPMRHYLHHGRHEGRSSSLASHLIAEDLDEIAVDEGLIPAPEVDRESPDYLDALAVSVRAIDKDLRYFSRKFYFARYPDIENQPLDPVVHYLKYGRHEGRVTNVTLLEGVYVNESAINPELPFVLVGVHEASTTGAPIVGMDLAREMRSEYNVVFVSLRDGPLLEAAKAVYPVVITATHSDDDNHFFVDFIAEQYPVKDAIFSSSACVPFIRPLASLDCRITCLVHEFLEYMIHVRSIIYLCDLLVFSSRELLKSWQYMLDDLERDPETIMVLPQPGTSGNSRAMSKEDARAVIEESTGLDLEGAILVLGAGMVQIRKGTDIFLQVGNQLKREEGKFVTVWIGQQVSEFDMSFGVWFHAQIERSRDKEGNLAVHFEPAGPLYPVLMDAADVFLVTSRLDPLPNVALDAAARDLPVIAFAGATGLADLAERGEMNLIEVEIAAVDEVVAAIKACTGNDTSGSSKIGSPTGKAHAFTGSKTS